MSRNIGYDRNLTIFSPEGKLFQLEYAFKAIRLPGDTTIGIRGNDTVCLITQKKVQDKLIDGTSITKVYNITKYIGCIATGRIPDSRALIYKCRQLASEFKFDNGYDIPVKNLANELANYNQVYTQHAYKRVPGTSLMFCSVDDELGPRLYLVDPAGSCYGYKAVATGEKETEAMSILEKLIKEYDTKNINLDYNNTIELAIQSLQKVLGVDFKSNQVEVGIVTKENPQFRLLTESEIDHFLTAISEKDQE